MTDYIFVYGTLKRGYSNHQIIQDDVEFISDGIIGGHSMYYSGGISSFPVLFKETDSKVIGEIYKIDNKSVIDKMDWLESNGNMYNRTDLLVHTADLKMYRSYVYVGNENFWDKDTMKAVSENRIKEWR